jgi:transposase-like protein
LPEVAGDKEPKKKFKTYPIGYFHIDIAEARTAEGKLYLYVGIDRTSKFAFVQLVSKANRVTASAFLVALIAAVPYKIHTVLTDNGIQFTLGYARLRLPAAIRQWPDSDLHVAHVRPALRRERDRPPAYQDQAPLDQWAGRTDEPHNQGSHRQTLSL